MAGAFCRGESGHVGSPPKVAKSRPRPSSQTFQTDRRRSPREHDGDERRSVVPEHHPPVEVGRVVVHEIKQRILVQQGEGKPDKAPHSVPQAGKKQKSVRNESPPFHRSVSVVSAPRLGAIPGLPAGINKDESDPAWGRIGACDTVPLSGPHDPPLLVGVALVLSDLPGSVRGRPMSRRQTQRNERDKGS